jgi:UDP:flavonoid glycosyltransferase YjiC (YdhE family)
MKKVLIANELGTGYGHMRNMLPIVEALDARGYKCILSMPDLNGAYALLKERRWPLVRSPRLTARNRLSQSGRAAASYSDIIAVYGYGEFELLLTAVSVWETLIRELEIDLVVGEHSPTLCLAAMGLAPMILVGEDFTFPPAGKDEFPAYNNLELAYSNELLLDNVARVQRARGLRVPDTITEVFRVAGRFVCSFPELDVFRDTRTDPVVGPIDAALSPLAPAPEPHIFAYLGQEFPRTRDILHMVAKSGIPAEAHIRGAGPKYLSEFDDKAITFYRQPQPIADMLQRCSVVIHHCGNGLMTNAAAAGRAQLLAPQHIGMQAHARVLERLGVGRSIHENLEAERSIAMIQNAATGATVTDRAQALAAEIEAAGPWQPIEHIANRCAEILAAPETFIH